MPKKEPAQNVKHATSNMMDLRQIKNSASDVGDVENVSFGNAAMLKNVTNFLGSNSGFKKVIPSGDSQSSRDTAHPKSSKSKIIGLSNPQSTIWTSLKSNMSSTMVLILDETTALSQS